MEDERILRIYFDRYFTSSTLKIISEPNNYDSLEPSIFGLDEQTRISYEI